MGIRILGTGSYLPAKVVTNGDIAASLDTSDEWIYTHTGIHSRHVAGEGETTSTMAAKAARAAMESAGVKPEEIGLILLATSTPDYNTFPATACIVQGLLGCVNAGACDLQAACSGFIYALEQARGYVRMHPGEKALVIGAECLTRIMDWADRSSCILFGDGAGAAVIGEGGGASGVEAVSLLGADGSGRHFIQRTGGTMKCLPFDAVTGVPMKPEPELPQFSLMGHEVFTFAVKTMAKVVEDVCAKGGVKPEEVDLIIAHQANRRIIESVARRMKLPIEKFWIELEETANTSAASIAIALDQATKAGRLKAGMRTVLVGFGSGLTFGGIGCVWPEV